MLEAGAPVPDLEVADDAGAAVSLTALRGGSYVLFFYPKDDTPGCTSVAAQFRDLAEAFAAKGVEPIGVSRDTAASHRRFKAKHDLPFRLLADVESRLCDAFGVLYDKTMYGKPVRGIRRSTFLVDDSGVVTRVWPNVVVEGHAADVLAALP